MRAIVICLMGATLLSACSKKPAAPAAPSAAPAASAAATPTAAAAPAAANGPEISGVYTVNGKAAALTQVSAHADEPFDGKPITALVFTSKDQGGDDKAADHALFGQYGDGLLIKVTPDGQVIECEVINTGLAHGGSVSISGVLTVKDFQSSGGQISGHLTSGGPTVAFGDKINVDLTFHTKAP